MPIPNLFKSMLILTLCGVHATLIDPATHRANKTVIRYTAGQLADAIYWAEGGAKASQEYGINPKYWRCKNERACRKICLQTIIRNRERHKKAGQADKDNVQMPYLTFLANRYCPPSEDFIGNKNWKRNVKFYLRNPKEIKRSLIVATP